MTEDLNRAGFQKTLKRIDPVQINQKLKLSLAHVLVNPG